MYLLYFLIIIQKSMFQSNRNFINQSFLTNSNIINLNSFYRNNEEWQITELYLQERSAKESLISEEKKELINIEVEKLTSKSESAKEMLSNPYGENLIFFLCELKLKQNNPQQNNPDLFPMYINVNEKTENFNNQQNSFFSQESAQRNKNLSIREQEGSKNFIPQNNQKEILFTQELIQRNFILLDSSKEFKEISKKMRKELYINVNEKKSNEKTEDFNNQQNSLFLQRSAQRNTNLSNTKEKSQNNLIPQNNQKEILFTQELIQRKIILLDSSREFKEISKNFTNDLKIIRKKMRKELLKKELIERKNIRNNQKQEFCNIRSIIKKNLKLLKKEEIERMGLIIVYQLELENIEEEKNIINFFNKTNHLITQESSERTEVVSNREQELQEIVKKFNNHLTIIQNNQKQTLFSQESSQRTEFIFNREQELQEIAKEFSNHLTIIQNNQKNKLKNKKQTQKQLFTEELASREEINSNREKEFKEIAKIFLNINSIIQKNLKLLINLTQQEEKERKNFNKQEEIEMQNLIIEYKFELENIQRKQEIMDFISNINDDVDLFTCLETLLDMVVENNKNKYTPFKKSPVRLQLCAKYRKTKIECRFLMVVYTFEIFFLKLKNKCLNDPKFFSVIFNAFMDFMFLDFINFITNSLKNKVSNILLYIKEILNKLEKINNSLSLESMNENNENNLMFENNKHHYYNLLKLFKEFKKENKHDHELVNIIDDILSLKIFTINLDVDDDFFMYLSNPA